MHVALSSVYLYELPTMPTIIYFLYMDIMNKILVSSGSSVLMLGSVTQLTR